MSSSSAQSSPNPASSFFVTQQHGEGDARASTPTPRSPFRPVRQHSSTSPPASPLLSQPLRATRSQHPRAGSSSSTASASSSSTTSGGPLLASTAHNLPSLSFHPSSPTTTYSLKGSTSPSIPTTSAPKIRARVTPSATPRRKIALPGTEFADVPTPRAGGGGVAGSPTKQRVLQHPPQPIQLPRIKPISFREMDDEMEGLGRGLAGLGLGMEASPRMGMVEAPRMVPIPMMPREERRTQGGRDNVLVCLRVRPPAAKLAQATQVSNDIAWDVHPATGTVSLQSQPATEYVFDSIVTGSDNDGVYQAAGRDLVLAAMEGFDAVIFAYGQTASGKTFTLSGNSANPGVIPQAVTEIFSYIQSHPEKTYLLRASYLEIYNETLKDLLAPDSGPLRIRQDEKKRFFVHPLREEVVTGEDQVASLLRRGAENRHTGQTDFNAHSSRSHSVFQITIESRDDDDAVSLPSTPMRSKTPNTPRLTPGANGIVRMSRLSLIDLAGSEQATSQTERRSEGAFINKSLLTLEKVIASLTEDSKKKPHVPYRDSKLTQILQPSLSGDARVAVIATMNPSPTAVEETKSTLKFATRVKKVVLKAMVNEVAGEQALIHKYQSTILELQAQLKLATAAANSPSIPSTPSPEEVALREKKAKDLRSQIDGLSSLFLTSGNVEKRRKSVLPPRPVSPMKMRRSTEPDIDEEDLSDSESPSLSYEERYLDCHDELVLIKEENAELKQRLADLESADGTDVDSRVAELLRENRELRVIADNLGAESEVRLQAKRYERQLAQRDEYARGVRESLENERKKTKAFEAYVLQHLKREADALEYDRRRSSIGLSSGFGADLGASLLNEEPDLDAIRPEFVGLDVPVEVGDLDFSPEAQATIGTLQLHRRR